MSLKQVHSVQPKNLNFQMRIKKKEILKKYLKKIGRALYAFFLLKQNNNWIPLVALKYIANYLSMPYFIYEITTFYSYNLAQ